MNRKKTSFTKAAGLELLIDQYFKNIEASPIVENKPSKTKTQIGDKDQKPIKQQPDQYTIAGLALHLGFNSKQSFEEYVAGQTVSTTPLPERLGLNRLLISDGFPPEARYFTIALKYADEHSTHTITQTQTIRIDDAVDEQSVYLRWIGLSGSWNYYRFVYNQEISLDVQNATIIKNYVADWENQDGIEDVITKDAGQKMKVMAEDLSIKDIKGLQSIKYSPKVQMLVSKNPVKWQTIVINTATYSEYETLNGQAPFSVTFNMPSINIQTQ
ncbi:MAG TPA: hypothetical protein VK668_01480 [Mucilaginibacter sp.]|nr:hypothetical protein [Mucilaginibacter sp.]